MSLAGIIMAREVPLLNTMPECHANFPVECYARMHARMHATFHHRLQPAQCLTQCSMELTKKCYAVLQEHSPSINPSWPKHSPSITSIAPVLPLLHYPHAMWDAFKSNCTKLPKRRITSHLKFPMKCQQPTSAMAGNPRWLNGPH